MKKCFKCGDEKYLSEFYKHGAMKDGRSGKCKECTKTDVRENRMVKSEYYRKYEKMRFQTQPHRAERNRAYAKTEAGIASMDMARKMWVTKNPEKRAAHIILANAIRDGKVAKPRGCSICGEIPDNSRLLHGHHDDYTKPLDVTWMCVGCHAKHHWPDNEFRA